MLSLAKWLEGGGPVMYLLLFPLAPLVMLAGLLHLIVASRKSFLLLCLCLALTLGAGLAGTGWYRRQMATILPMAHPEERLSLAIAGYREANRPFKLALAIGLCGLLPYSLGELRRHRRGSGAPPPPRQGG
jgi:hypothetical protein